MGQAPSNFEGRMTFFVQPSNVIRTEMIAELIKQEYEVYLINDAANAKRIFYQYPNCLALLNIDAGFSEFQWLQFVREVQQDPLLKNVRIGVLTYNPDNRLAEEYLTDLRVPCEFVKLSPKLKDSLKSIKKVLDGNEAKGRRRFLRIPCDQNSRLSFRDSHDLIDGHILDLSSVGMTCILYPDKRWPKRSAFAFIRLKLENTFCTVSGVVLDHRRLEPGGGTIYVILFDTKTEDSSLEKIRAYLQKTLQSSLELSLKEDRPRIPGPHQGSGVSLSR
jgi:hypothetical protein